MSKKNINILFYSGSRSEYGILKYLIKPLQEEKTFNTKLLLSGTHFSGKFGNTFSEVATDGVKFDKILNNSSSDSYLDLNKSLAMLQKKISKYLDKKKFDIIFLLGDRIDLLPVASSALLKGIKICHLHGGELTMHLIDEYVRHAITKLSNFHFVANKKYKKRVVQMGENPKNVFNVGSLAVDGISKMKFLNKKFLGEKFKINLSKNFFIITYQPLSLNQNKSKEEFNFLINALLKYKHHNLIFTFPNLDLGSQYIIGKLKSLKKKYDNIHIFKSLGHLNYISLARYSSLVIGNSSSGIIEIPFLGIPVINIGTRQYGREKNKNILNISNINKKSLSRAIAFAIQNKNKIYKLSHRNKTYGTGNAVNKIIYILKNKINFKQDSKIFYDII